MPTRERQPHRTRDAQPPHGAASKKVWADRTGALEAARLETLERLAIAMECRGIEAKQHGLRVGRVAALMAERLGLSANRVYLIRHAAAVHDVGKLAIPDAILLKPGRLTADERWLMQTHTTIGAEILASSRAPVLRTAERIGRSHHERWDGTGYPDNLLGDAIPLGARIVAVADVFDALSDARPHRSAWPQDEDVEEIHRGSGSQFDPRVVDAFTPLDHPHLLRPVEPQSELGDR